MTKIGVIVGSLRKGSYNRKVAQEIIDLLPEGYEGTIIDNTQLALYNEDIDQGNPPQAYVDFRNELEKYDAWLFATPEYNRSYSAVMKNTLDVGSRPVGENRWGGKPGAVVSASPGSFGGFGANHHIRQPLMLLDVPLLQQPEVYLANVSELIDDEGNFNEDTREFLQDFVHAYVDFIDRFVK